MERELPHALTATWKASGVEPVPFDAEPRSTMRRVAQDDPNPLGATVMDGPRAEIIVGAVLGEGGMGVVHEGHQRSLRREVAIKRLRADADAEAIARLLREARITGQLEHPNIVPIHLLTRDESGEPLIVMKRIEGRPWTELLGDATQRERGSEAYQRLHLGILVQVARALHFAHRRRVLHRDIKPDNVMIGAFGEVYLVDWGIAVGLSPVPDGLLAAKDVHHIEGTPLYLAPEMAAGAGEELDERTDVYLLGATLHEVLVGQAPHHATDARAAVVKAFLAEPPQYPSSIPDELGDIARRALSRDRDARYPSAEAFAEALESFLVHRGSTSLREAATRRASELDALIGRTEGGLTPEAYALFHQARFAFEHALIGWPENVEAKRGLHALLSSMIELELTRGTPGAAQALLPSLDTSPELRARVDAAVTAERERLASLKAIAHEADVGLGAKTRQRNSYLAAASWCVSLLAAAALDRSGVLSIGPLEFAGINLGFFVGTLITTWVTRKDQLANVASRRVIYTTLLVFGAGVVLWPAFGALGLSMPESTMLGAFISALLWATAIWAIGVPWIPMVIGQLATVALVFLMPHYHLEIFGITGGLQSAAAAWLMIRR
jgi:serine/threonine-protein kinase